MRTPLLYTREGQRRHSLDSVDKSKHSLVYTKLYTREGQRRHSLDSVDKSKIISCTHETV